MNTKFQGNKTANKNASYKCLSLIIIDSVMRENKQYYPPTHLEECKYKIGKSKIQNFISDD